MKVAILSLPALLMIAAGCSHQPAKINAAVGIPIEHFGALPCRLVSAEPETAVKVEPTKAYLMGNPNNIDPSTVRLTASAPAKANVDCHGKIHPVEFFAIAKVEVEEPTSSKAGAEAKYDLAAYSKEGVELDITGMPWEAVTWNTSGPVAAPTPDTHSVFPGGGPHTKLVLAGKGKVTVTANYAGMTATRSTDVE